MLALTLGRVNARMPETPSTAPSMSPLAHTLPFTFLLTCLFQWVLLACPLYKEVPVKGSCWNTVVPHLTMLSCSSKIAVERKRRKEKLKNPLKHIKPWLMHSNGLKTHRPAKILHTAAIFGACIARNPSLSTAGSHFEHLEAILKTRQSAVGKSSFCEESVPEAGNQSLQSEKRSQKHRNAVLS